MRGEFEGWELYTPLGRIAVGRRYSGATAKDYFRGVKLELPIGRFRAGRRAWDEAEDDFLRRARAEQVYLWLRHFFVYFWMVCTIFLFDLVIGRGDWFVNWVASVWGAILGLHLMGVLLAAMNSLWPRFHQKDGSLGTCSPPPP